MYMVHVKNIKSLPALYGKQHSLEIGVDWAWSFPYCSLLRPMHITFQISKIILFLKDSYHPIFHSTITGLPSLQYFILFFRLFTSFLALTLLLFSSPSPLILPTVLSHYVIHFKSGPLCFFPHLIDLPYVLTTSQPPAINPLQPGSSYDYLKS